MELRIDTTGESRPDELLGLNHPEDAVAIDQGRHTAFHSRRSDPGIEGYTWGGLTSASPPWRLAQWLLLLPFSVANAAGWMVAGHRRRAIIARTLVVGVGLALTATTAVWIGIILGDYLAYQQAGRVDSPGWTSFVLVVLFASGPVVGGLIARRPVPVVIGVVVLAFAIAARLVGGGFFRAFVGIVLGEALILTLLCAAARAPNQRERLFDREEHELEGPQASRMLLFVHLLVFVAVTVALVVRSVAVTSSKPPNLGFDVILRGLWILQAILLALLVMATVGRDDEGVWRFAGPAVLLLLAAAVSNAMFSGAAAFVAALSPTQTGSELALVHGFAWDYLGGVYLLVVALLPALWRRPPPRDDVNEQDRKWSQRREQRRRIAALVRNADLFWTVVAIVVACTIVLGPVSPWSGWSREGNPTLSGLLLLVGLPAISVAIRSLARRQGMRVGFLRDVLTSFPRHFHPLAPSPYTAPAVRRLRQHLLAHMDEGRPVIVSAHGQGSLLAFLALRRLGYEHPLHRVALVTYGSPLRDVYVRWFPGFVQGEEIEALRHALSSWRNFFRRTDPIGQNLFGPGGDPHGDVELSDPAEQKGTNPGGALPFAIEPDRTPWSDIACHEDYRREPALKAWVRSVKTELDPRGTQLLEEGPLAELSERVETDVLERLTGRFALRQLVNFEGRLRVELLEDGFQLDRGPEQVTIHAGRRYQVRLVIEGGDQSDDGAPVAVRGGQDLATAPFVADVEFVTAAGGPLPAVETRDLAVSPGGRAETALVVPDILAAQGGRILVTLTQFRRIIQTARLELVTAP